MVMRCALYVVEQASCHREVARIVLVLAMMMPSHCGMVLASHAMYVALCCMPVTPLGGAPGPMIS